jgi:AcrR family transcriptional regulator
MNRSEQRIPKLRTRGRENRRKLLKMAEKLLAETQGEAPRFSNVFKAAGVSRGSAYRIYIGMDDLMQDLAGEWINNFVDYLCDLEPENPPETWQQLSNMMVERGTAYWANTINTIRVLPRVRLNAPASYTSVLRDLSNGIANLFDQFFIMPEIEGWAGKLSFYVQLGDAVFSDAVRVDDQITVERMKEAQTLCRTYLSFHLPELIPARRRAD